MLRGGYPLRSVAAGGNTTTLLWCHWRGHPNLAGSSLQSAGVAGWELVPWFVPIYSVYKRQKERKNQRKRLAPYHFVLSPTPGTMASCFWFFSPEHPKGGRGLVLACEILPFFPFTFHRCHLSFFVWFFVCFVCFFPASPFGC